MTGMYQRGRARSRISQTTITGTVRADVIR